MTTKGIRLNPLGDRVFIVILRENEKTDGGIVKPNHSLKWISPSRAAARAETRADIKEIDYPEFHEEMRDAEKGYFEAFPLSTKKFCHGLVIGENLTPRNDLVAFGDVVMFNQQSATDYTAFWKLPCSNPATNEIYVCSADGRTWLKLPKSAEVVIAPITELLWIEKTFQEMSGQAAAA